MNARSALTLALALALGSCGGNSEKEALRAYEAGVEDLMAEDGKVSAHLKDIREDLITANATEMDLTDFARDQALPFYRRFREAAAKAVTSGERLPQIHKDLQAYLDDRLAYLESMDAFGKGATGDPMERLQAAQAPLDAAQKDLQRIYGGSGSKVPQDVAEVLGTAVQFMERVYGPFQRGQMEGDAVEKVLRGEVLPRISRLAERTKGERAAEGDDGIVARWAAAEQAFFQELAACIPRQAVLLKAGAAAEEKWKSALDRREKFLTGLRSYRESLR